MEREHFSKQYDTELNDIREKLLVMGGKVEVMIANAMKSLVERDTELAERTIAFDHEINHLEVEIDEKCLQVNEALDRLAEIDPRKAEVVKMRMFVGLEVQEIAAALNASEKTVQRDWTYAKAWLSRELKQGA